MQVPKILDLVHSNYSTTNAHILLLNSHVNSSFYGITISSSLLLLALSGVDVLKPA